MARIIPLHGDEHHEVRLLLPWYVTGRLDAVDHARVESHLAGCADCQAELRFERKLGAEVADLPLEVERGWAELKGKILAQELRGRAGGPARGGRQTAWMWGAIAAQLVLLLMLGALTLHGLKAARYQTLGSPGTASTGNVVVMFKPDTPERDLRKVLDGADARLADGPTAAGAYVLRAPAQGRNAALARLRADPSVLLAQPIDADGSR